MLEFPTTLIWTETHVFMYVSTTISCKNNVTQSITNVTRLYVIDDVIKSNWRSNDVMADSAQTVPSQCSDLSTNKSLNLSIGYIGDQC